MEKVRKIASNVWLLKDSLGEFRYGIYGDNGEFLVASEGHRDGTDAMRAFRQLVPYVLRAAAEFSGEQP